MADVFKTLEDGSVVKVTETSVSTEELTGVKTQLEANVESLKPQVEAADENSARLHGELEVAEAELANFNANVQFPVAEVEPEPAEGVSDSVDSAVESEVGATDSSANDEIVSF